LDAEPMLRGSVEGERFRLAAAGAWTADHAHELEPLIETATRNRPEVKSVSLDLAAVERLDTFGAWLMERLLRAWRAAGREASLVGVPENYQGLFSEVHQVNTAPAAVPPAKTSFADNLETVGRSMAALGRDIVAIVAMLGGVAVALGRVFVRPHTFRLTSVVHHLDRVCFRAVPIILLITFLVGCIIAQQGIFHFRKFGADVYVVDMVGILVLRELGVLIVAVMVAGRSGSAYTAELGSMKMREEVDALRTMGFDPIEVLILPRIIALVIALPILTFLGSMAALYGGGLVCWLYGGISPDIFISRLKDAISLDHFQVGMYKAPFMALVIGMVACVEGLQTQGSAESLGLQTTSSVVKSIFLTIVLDGLFAVFFAAIGK
jgi:phospholipid/cholesterol/gamma-HCH transport system permease protein